MIYSDGNVTEYIHAHAGIAWAINECKFLVSAVIGELKKRKIID
jgi:hypothetical protein